MWIKINESEKQDAGTTLKFNAMRTSKANCNIQDWNNNSRQEEPDIGKSYKFQTLAQKFFYTPINLMMIRKKIQVIFNKVMAAPIVTLL
jgi:hypothetical protein